MRASPAPALAFVAVAGLAAAGCGGGAPAQCPPAATQPSFEFGVLHISTFTPFQDGDHIAIIHGIQGGTWVMPAMRLTGCGANGDMTASATIVGGPLLGQSSHPIRLDNLGDGALVIEYMPVPIGGIAGAPGSPTPEQADGMMARLQATYKDTCGNTLEHMGTLQLVLQAK